MIEDIITLLNELDEKIKEIISANKKGLTQYAEGKIDGINYAIRELEKLLKMS